MSQTDKLRGAYCPLVVPFKNGQIDYGTYESLVERQISQGTHGLLVNATSGEPTMLTAQERGDLAEFVVKISKGRLPVCAGTASESFEQTALLVERFDKIDVDSIVIVTPFYSAPPQRGVLEYFTKLGARTEKPLLAYHIPGRAAFRLEIDTLAAIKERVPHFVGLKNTDADMEFVTGAIAKLGRDFRIFAGSELPALPTLAVGGSGLMITASNVAPKLVAQLYDAIAARDIARATEVNLKLYPLFRGVAFESSPIPIKYMLKRLGVLKANEHRLPLVPASAETEQRLDRVLRDVGLL